MNAISGTAPLRTGAFVPRTVAIAAGGTGGHFIPAEALGVELKARGHRVLLMTDRRSGGERSGVFAGPDAHVLPGAGIIGRSATQVAGAALALTRGVVAARRVLRGAVVDVVVGFGGYPSVGPVLGTRLLRRRPRVVLHEGNATLGGANRVLARFADHLALSLPGTARLPARVATTLTGIPVRAPIAALAGAGYVPPEPGAPINLLVTGGSLGARVIGRTVPAAIALLPAELRTRLRVVQQCRAEDLDAARDAYAAAGVPAELAPFLGDMPRRLTEAHFVIGRAGASTVAELAAVGRPCLLVPLPSADGHQRLNAAAIDAGLVGQAEIEHKPAVLAGLLADRLSDPDLLAAGAHAVARHGITDAARRLADLVEAVTADPAGSDNAAAPTQAKRAPG